MMQRIVYCLIAGSFLLACSNENGGFRGKPATQTLKKAEESNAKASQGSIEVPEPAMSEAEPVEMEMPAVLPAPEVKVEPPVPVPEPEPKPVIPPEAIRAQKVGVNFEDNPPDNDYNDAVMCFTGGFAVTESEIVSLQDQKLAADMYSNAGFNNILVVEIVRDGKVVHHSEYEPKKQTSIPSLEFKKGDRLVASIKSQGVGAAHPMTDAVWAQFKPDLCNDR